MTGSVGFFPITEIVLAAAVNGKDDDRFLGQLAVAIARRYGSLIDLDGGRAVSETAPSAPGQGRGSLAVASLLSRCR